MRISISARNVSHHNPFSKSSREKKNANNFALAHSHSSEKWKKKMQNFSFALHVKCAGASLYTEFSIIIGRCYRMAFESHHKHPKESNSLACAVQHCTCTQCTTLTHIPLYTWANLKELDASNQVLFFRIGFDEIMSNDKWNEDDVRMMISLTCESKSVNMCANSVSNRIPYLYWL